jgi:hypothetical protein
MAKKAGPTSSDIEWIHRDRRVIDGLDHLGIELISVNLYQAMLPGITNITERARYYSFYPWCIHRYAQDGSTNRTRTNWIKWLRALDFSYATACVAYDQKSDHESGSAVVGGDRASELVNGKALKATIDLRTASAVNETGKVESSGAYFKNPQGGFGQYYRGPLREMAMLREHEQNVWPDVSLTNYAGHKIADVIDRQTAFQDLLEIAVQGRATVGELSKVGSKVHPSSIEPRSREEEILRSVFLGTDVDLCRGQAPEQMEWRSRSLRLMLDYIQRSEIEESPDYEFRWACLAKALPDDSPWKCSADLTTVRSAWGAYQRNDTLNYCLECLMGVILDLLEDGPRRPGSLSEQIADMAMAPMGETKDFGELRALPNRVSQWIAACERPLKDAQAEPWGEMSTWRWVDRLESACDERNLPTLCGLAVRVLGRLVTDRGDVNEHPFASIPHAMEMAQSHEIHLQSWWNLITNRGDDSTRDFLVRLLLDWVIFRHLRVATRKLAGQGVSTYKFRPEEGQLVLVAERLPTATFTSPRVRQAYRILTDLHFVKGDAKGWSISQDGIKAISI